jgi:hypothetical protein
MLKGHQNETYDGIVRPNEVEGMVNRDGNRSYNKKNSLLGRGIVGNFR